MLLAWPNLHSWSHNFIHYTRISMATKKEKLLNSSCQKLLAQPDFKIISLKRFLTETLWESTTFSPWVQFIKHTENTWWKLIKHWHISPNSMTETSKCFCLNLLSNFPLIPHVLNVYTCERYRANKVLLFFNYQFHNI